MDHRHILLLILDGWGYNPDNQYNAIANAHTPHWDYLWQSYPHTLLHCSGESVGLPDQQMGNSEVGHMHIGAGRSIDQDLTRVNHAITSGAFKNNRVFQSAFRQGQKRAIHVLGLLSPGGVHSHEDQIFYFLEQAMAAGIQQLYLHAFLDGRDTPPKSAETSLRKAMDCFEQVSPGRVASICGRYYAMDRDKRWDRTQAAYDCISQAKSAFQATDPVHALQTAYERGESDEFVSPTTIGKPVPISPGDVVVFLNFRADRARQLSRAFTEVNFTPFEQIPNPEDIDFVTLTDYDRSLSAKVAFPYQRPKNTLGEFLSTHHLRQLRVAETEKYAHVTFFFNGGCETAFPGEDRILIPSLKIATYDKKPEMSAPAITETLLRAIKETSYDLIVCNYANPDMVGHTGDFSATVKAIEYMDHCIGKLYQAIKKHGGEIIITADHGNAEYMFDPKTQQPHTAHTTNPVPLLYVGRPGHFSQNGRLQDLAPTLLYLLDLKPPPEMDGNILFQLA